MSIFMILLFFSRGCGQGGGEPSFIGLGINSNNLFVKLTVLNLPFMCIIPCFQGLSYLGIGPSWVRLKYTVVTTKGPFKK